MRAPPLRHFLAKRKGNKLCSAQTEGGDCVLPHSADQPRTLLSPPKRNRGNSHFCWSAAVAENSKRANGKVLSEQERVCSHRPLLANSKAAHSNVGQPSLRERGRSSNELALVLQTALRRIKAAVKALTATVVACGLSLVQAAYLHEEKTKVRWHSCFRMLWKFDGGGRWFLLVPSHRNATQVIAEIAVAIRLSNEGSFI